MVPAVTRDAAARAQLAPVAEAALSLRAAVEDLSGPQIRAARPGCVMSGNPIVGAVEGALRILGAETREVAEVLIDAAPVELTDRERAAVLARFTSAAEYRRDDPVADGPLRPHVGYSFSGRWWPDLNRPR
jgi:hypothetical protein